MLARNLLKRMVSTAKPKKVMITGAFGQVGKTMIDKYSKKYGLDNVLATDIVPKPDNYKGKYVKLDVTNLEEFSKLAKEHQATTILHFGAILSGVAEKNPTLARLVNGRGNENAFDVALENNAQIFIPSSIAAFGENCPKEATEDPPLIPNSIYGVEKVHLELMGRYYYRKYGLDFRSIRYPVVVSPEEYDYAGTATYSTEIFFKALRDKKYTIFLHKDTYLPYIYVDNSIECTLKLLEAPNENLTRRTYNMNALSFTPLQLAEAIKKRIPEFTYDFIPDFRAATAESWPDAVVAPSNTDFGYKDDMDLNGLVDKMFEVICPQIGISLQSQ